MDREFATISRDIKTLRNQLADAKAAKKRFTPHVGAMQGLLSSTIPKVERAEAAAASVLLDEAQNLGSSRQQQGLEGSFKMSEMVGGPGAATALSLPENSPVIGVIRSLEDECKRTRDENDTLALEVEILEKQLGSARTDMEQYLQKIGAAEEDFDKLIKEKNSLTAELAENELIHSREMEVSEKRAAQERSQRVEAEIHMQHIKEEKRMIEDAALKNAHTIKELESMVESLKGRIIELEPMEELAKEKHELFDSQEQVLIGLKRDVEKRDDEMRIQMRSYSSERSEWMERESKYRSEIELEKEKSRNALAQAQRMELLYNNSITFICERIQRIATRKKMEGIFYDWKRDAKMYHRGELLNKRMSFKCWNTMIRTIHSRRRALKRFVNHALFRGWARWNECYMNRISIRHKVRSIIYSWRNRKLGMGWKKWIAERNLARGKLSHKQKLVLEREYWEKVLEEEKGSHAISSKELATLKEHTAALERRLHLLEDVLEQKDILVKELEHQAASALHLGVSKIFHREDMAVLRFRFARWARNHRANMAMHAKRARSLHHDSLSFHTAALAFQMWSERVLARRSKRHSFYLFKRNITAAYWRTWIGIVTVRKAHRDLLRDHYSLVKGSWEIQDLKVKNEELGRQNIDLMNQLTRSNQNVDLAKSDISKLEARIQEEAQKSTLQIRADLRRKGALLFQGNGARTLLHWQRVTRARKKAKVYKRARPAPQVRYNNTRYTTNVDVPIIPPTPAQTRHAHFANENIRPDNRTMGGRLDGKSAKKQSIWSVAIKKVLS